MADTRVVPVSSVKYGLKAETSFGVGLDTDLSSGGDTTAYLTQPVIQAQKPVFNITRESRLLSGRGTVKNAADTIVMQEVVQLQCHLICWQHQEL